MPVRLFEEELLIGRIATVRGEVAVKTDIDLGQPGLGQAIGRERPWIFPQVRRLRAGFQGRVVHLLAELGDVEIIQDKEAIGFHVHGVVVHLAAGDHLPLALGRRLVAGTVPAFIGIFNRRDEHPHIGKIIGQLPSNSEGHFLETGHIDGPFITGVSPTAGHLIGRRVRWIEELGIPRHHPPQAPPPIRLMRRDIHREAD